MWQFLCWTIGWLLFVYAMCGAPGSMDGSFSWHMIMYADGRDDRPLLLVPAAPITLALRAAGAPGRDLGSGELILAVVHSHYLRIFANPIVAAVMFFSPATFYFTPLFSYALTTHTGHILMTVHFLLSGHLFAWVLVGTDPARSSGRR